MTVRIGNAAGFLGDDIDAPRRLVEQCELDYLTLEYLAELTMGILARRRMKDPAAGFAGDFLDVLASLAPSLYLAPTPKIVTNAGGVNPLACAHAAGKVLVERGCGDLAIGVILGDDLFNRLEELFREGVPLAHLDTGEPLTSLHVPILAANAYLGAAPIVEALGEGARLVITGRVADASLTVAPAVYEHSLNWNEWNALAAASLAGHLIECGAQVTGGYRATWRGRNLADVGYPIAELDREETIITKPPGTGGAVDLAAVAEQLVYEIGDPTHYLTPDVDVDMTSVQLNQVGPDRVRVTGARGRPAPNNYKVSVAYQAGFAASGQLVVYGADCVAKAEACAAMVHGRLARAKLAPERYHVELLGAGQSVPGLHTPPDGLREVVMRIGVADSRREAVERFTRELAPLITSGPAGLSGYAAGRNAIRPALGHWPALIPRDQVAPQVDVRTALDWANR